MAELDDAVLRWVLERSPTGTVVAEVRGLRDGGSPWLVRLTPPAGTSRESVVVVRVGDAESLGTEVAGLRTATAHGVPAPALLDADLARTPALVMTALVAGSSTIPATPAAGRLRRLGAAAARLHAIPAVTGEALPPRSRPIPGADFAALRRAYGRYPLLSEAEERVAGYRPDGPVGFVHGDLWQGNSMWQGDELVGLIDWDCAGVGPAGVDLGSLRCDAALCYGPHAADEVLAGWESAASRPADAVAYWDAVAALASPPDMGWFTQAIAGQGRPDLDQHVLVARRDAFLRAALDRR